MKGFTPHGSVGPEVCYRYAQRLERRYDQEKYCKNRDRVENSVRGKLSAKGLSQRDINKLLLPKWAANLKDDHEAPSSTS